MPGLESAVDQRFRRVTETGVVELAAGPTGIEATGNADRTVIDRLLDRGHEPAELAAAVGDDPVLGPLLTRAPEIRVPGAWSGFELAVRAVLGQQVSIAGARRTTQKLVLGLGEQVSDAPGLTHLFPTPTALADGPLPGMPRARERALRALATAVADGLALDPPLDVEATRAALLELPGFGPWTVEYVAMRALGDRDAWPGGDLWLRRAVADADPERWRPWRAYAAMLLWQLNHAG